MFAALLLNAVMSMFVSSPTQLYCEATEPECFEGDCANVHADWTLTIPRSPTGNIVVNMHLCNSMMMTCSSVTGSFPPSQATRVQLCKDGCKLTISPKQGLTWGGIADCDDVAHDCGDC